MDKQQAVTYIQTRLEQDVPCEQIVHGLVDQLHAPEAMVTKFVAQVEAEYHKNKPQPPEPPLPQPIPPQPVKLPPWLEELTTGSASAGQPAVQQAPAAASDSIPAWASAGGPAQPAAQPAPAAPVASTTMAVDAIARPSWEAEARAFALAQLKIGRLHSDIAAELADRVGIPLRRAEGIVTLVAAQVEAAPRPRITNTTQAADFVSAEYARKRPKMEIVAELSMRSGEPQDKTAKFVDLMIAKLEKSKAQAAPNSFGQPAIDLNNPANVNYVVGELVKQRKRSDIVMALCERTGVEWSEAQRFVGQVNAEQQTKINARKNRLIIPMCIGAIALGLVFTLGTAYPMIYWFSGRTSEFTSAVQSGRLMLDYLQAAPFIFGTGIALVAGGVFGLITALKSQME